MNLHAHVLMSYCTVVVEVPQKSSSPPKEEVDALIELYNATQGHTWNWISNFSLAGVPWFHQGKL